MDSTTVHLANRVLTLLLTWWAVEAVIGLLLMGAVLWFWVRIARRITR